MDARISALLADELFLFLIVTALVLVALAAIEGARRSKLSQPDQESEDADTQAW